MSLQNPALRLSPWAHMSLVAPTGTAQIKNISVIPGAMLHRQCWSGRHPGLHFSPRVGRSAQGQCLGIFLCVSLVAGTVIKTFTRWMCTGRKPHHLPTQLGPGAEVQAKGHYGGRGRSHPSEGIREPSCWDGRSQEAISTETGEAMLAPAGSGQKEAPSVQQGGQQRAPPSPPLHGSRWAAASLAPGATLLIPQPKLGICIFMKCSHRRQIFPLKKKKSRWIGGEKNYIPIHTNSI